MEESMIRGNTCRGFGIALALVAAMLFPRLTLAQVYSDMRRPAPAPSGDLAALERYVDRLEAIDAAKRLQYLFGYYEDAFEPQKMLELFTDDAVVDYAGGKYIGRASIKRLLDDRFAMAGMAGRTGPQPHVVNDHYLMQGVLDASDDGQSVLGRFRDQVFQAQEDREASTASGLYEVQYVRRGHAWRIAQMVYCEEWRNFHGIALNFTPLPVYPLKAPQLFPEDPRGPDRVSSYNCHPWPYAGITPPMHYPHPITGDFILKP
jgi:SnoaL-like domain